MQIIKIKNQKAINLALKIIRMGGVIICPTDTVYGFLADASNKKAVEKIYKIKERPRSKPLPVFVKDIKTAKKFALVDREQERILNKKWPGKYTFILNIKKGIKLFGVKKDAVAIRIPKYKFLNNLLERLNRSLVQTSVNISGQPALTKIKEIIKTFGNGENQPDLVIDAGNLPKSKPSTIIDLSDKKNNILRK